MAAMRRDQSWTHPRPSELQVRGRCAAQGPPTAPTDVPPSARRGAMLDVVVDGVARGVEVLVDPGLGLDAMGPGFGVGDELPRLRLAGAAVHALQPLPVLPRGGAQGHRGQDAWLTGSASALQTSGASENLYGFLPSRSSSACMLNRGNSSRFARIDPNLVHNWSSLARIRSMPAHST